MSLTINLQATLGNYLRLIVVLLPHAKSDISQIPQSQFRLLVVVSPPFLTNAIIRPKAI